MWRGDGRTRLVAAVLVGAMVAGASAWAAATPPAQASVPVVRAAFYYPWFPNAWNQHGIDPFTWYHPTAGFYSSADAALVAQQIAAMEYGHLEAGIISWWGQGSQEDRMVPLDLAAADHTGFKWVLYYEPEGYGTPSVAQIKSDLSYIKTNYASNRHYLTIDGKPVIFVYGGNTDDCSTAGAVAEGERSRGFLHRPQGVRRVQDLCRAAEFLAPVRALVGRGPPGRIFVHHLARVPQGRQNERPARPGPRPVGRGRTGDGRLG